jgi:hypothetical protein
MMKVIMVSTIMTNLVFCARGSLVNSPSELTSKRRGRPPKVENMLHGLSDALTRYLNVVTTGRRAAADAKK